ncbi:unnamed protein product, partial [Didymodactylos carnosus]
HCRIGHGGRTRTLKEIQKKYCNITKQQVETYLSVCEICQRKRDMAKKNIVVKPIRGYQVLSRAQPDSEYKFLMNYQDHFSKFTVLRPLKNKTAVEVGRELVNIFSLFGALTILQSDNGREFVNHIIDSLAELWPGLKVVHGKPRHQQSQGSVEKCNHDIETKLTVWMQEHRRAKWTEGVPIAMYQKNASFHSRLKMTPYEAFFGRATSLGLSGSVIPKQAWNAIENKDNLQELLDEQDFGNHLKDDDTNENCSVKVGDNQPSSDITTNPPLTVQANSIDKTNICCICEFEIIFS